MELLLAADPQLDLEVVNNHGWTPLRVADGVMVEAGTALHFGPAVAAQLRELLKERGLPVPEVVPFDAAQIPPYSDR